MDPTNEKNMIITFVNRVDAEKVRGGFLCSSRTFGACGGEECVYTYIMCGGSVHVWG